MPPPVPAALFLPKLKAASSSSSFLPFSIRFPSFSSSTNQVRILPYSASATRCPVSASSTRSVRWWARPGSVTGVRGLVSGGGDGKKEVMGSDSGLARRSRSQVGEAMASGLYKGNGVPPSPPSQSSSRLLTLPTVLTISRVAAVPLLVSTFYMEGPWAATATTTIFLAAAITDWLDGYIARKLQMGTAFGAFLDPVADKLMVAATLILLCTKPLEAPLLGEGPWLLTVPAIAIIGREITMSAVREWAASQNSKVLEAVAVNKLGKWKTASQMTALTILLACRDPSLSGQTALVTSGVALLYVSAGLAVWSLVVYIRKIWRILLK